MRTLYALTALLIGTTGTLAAAQDGPSLHGFGEVSVKNDYVTPRGLVVTTGGATVQVLEGLVLVLPTGVAFHAGTWTDLNPGYSKTDGNISTINEFDFFVGADAEIAKGLKAGVEYVQFISGQPSVAFHDERNIEFSLKYSDAPSATFSFNPYAKLFWAFSSKSSTVVLGKAGGTFDIELGAVPTLKASAVTFSAQTASLRGLGGGRPEELLAYQNQRRRVCRGSEQFRRRFDGTEGLDSTRLHQGWCGCERVRVWPILPPDQ